MNPRQAVGSAQSYEHGVSGFLSLGIKRPEREAEQSPPSIAKVELELYSSMPSWCGQEQL